MIRILNSKYSKVKSFIITSCVACGTTVPAGLNCPHCRGFKSLSKSNLKKANIYKRFYSKVIPGIDKKSDSNVSSTSLKLVGETKHYPPANKEWTNSVYTYNKASLRSLSVKDNMAKKLIKSYFNLHIEKNIARSKRMRSLIRKSTTKKLFVSRPEIKQTNDKVIVTVYTFDRERQFLFRKLYFRISKWEKFKKVNRRIEVKLKSKNKGLKNKGLKKKILKKKFINKKIFKAKYFSKYDQWRLENKLFIKSFTQNVRKSSLNKTFDDLSYSELRKLWFLGAYEPHYLKKPVKAKLLKDKSFRTYALSKGFNKLVTFKTKKNKPTYYLSKPGNKNINSVIKKRKNLFKTSYKKVNFLIKRRKNFYPKQMFYKFKPWLKTTSMFKSFKRLLKKRSLMFVKRRLKVIRKKLPYFGFKHSNQINFFNSKINNKRLLDAKKMLLYFYIASALSLFNIKMLSFEDILKVSEKKIKKLKKEDYDLLERQNKNKKAFTRLASKKDKNILIKRKVPFYVRRFQKYKVPFNLGRYGSVVFYHKNNKYSISLKNLSFEIFVKILLSLLRKISLTTNLKQMAASYFKDFSNKFFLQVFYRSLFYAKNKKKLEKKLKKFNKDVLTINSLVKLAINQTKFGKFLPSLKLLISKIYNKKTELNIVNLKSPHLNTDIFTEAVAVKLKKRVGLLRVMRRSLQLVKLPSRFKRASEQFSVNDLGILNKFRFLNLNNLKNNLKGLNYSDSLQTILTSIYPRSFTLKPLRVYGLNGLYTLNSKNKRYYSKLNKLSGVLNQIKYKWTTGVRLEAAGRLTRRYTASRSVFKFRQKGSLQNTDYSRKLDFLGNSMPNIMLRNLAKSNSQHTFLASKKRIGAFGLNTVMSSY